jgi:hypothetical protein
MSDKRRYPRVDHKLLVSYDHFSIDNLKDDEGLARTLDMSVRGLLLQTPRAVDVGTTLRMALNLDGEIIEAFGKVTRCAKGADGLYETGVELNYVPEKFIAVVENYFRKRS